MRRLDRADKPKPPWRYRLNFDFGEWCTMLVYKQLEQNCQPVFDTIRVVGGVWPYVSRFGHLDKGGRLLDCRTDRTLTNIVHAAQLQQWMLM